MMENRLNFAAIDIGSNAVRLLIKGIQPGESARDLSKCVLLRIPLRLGDDAFGSGEISEAKAKQLLRTVKSFQLLMKVFDVVSYRACATSAMRDAANGARIAERIHRKTGIRIEVIDGLEEARIVYDSHIGHLFPGGGNYLYVDVGGGSTEINLICDGELHSSLSYNIGTVRMLRGKVKEADRERLGADLDPLAAKFPGLQLIGSGGNINKLYTLSDRARPGELPVEKLRRLYDQLLPLDPEQRMERFRLNPDRADVIVPAAEIFLTVADRVGATVVYVPTIGLIDGLTHTLCVEYLRTRHET